MKFEPTPLKDAWVLALEPHDDARGFFSRTFCRREFADHGIDFSVAQINTSVGRDAGTMRGLHYQIDPAEEMKLMQCVRGGLYDVIVDMRPDSPSYRQHFGIELTPGNGKMLFVPANFAHGFLTLEPDTQAYYMVSEFYAPGCERGVRYDDPALGIEWPVPVMKISEKDLSWPLL